MAFTGGLDLTLRDHDTSEHPLDGWRGGAHLLYKTTFTMALF